MLKNYLTIASRSLMKNKPYFFLNLFGLVLGLTSSMLLFFYVQEERNYDRFHKNSDHIYRVLQSFKNGDVYTTTALSPYKFAPLLADQHPGVKSYVRVDGSIGARLVEHGEISYQENRITFVDTTFFDVFSFKMLQGNPKTALIDPNTVVITQDIAEKYFGGEDPIGKVLKFKNTFNNTSFNATVTGITHIPVNSHFHRDFFISMKTGDMVTPGKINSWGWTSQYAYLLLEENTRPEDLQTAMKQVVADHAPDWFGEWAYFDLQALEKIHLHSPDIKDEMEAQGDANYVRIFSIVLIFILLIAGINYMNLATARSMERAKEVGLRKVVGAARPQLILQFLAEAMILSFFAFIITCFVLQFSTPLFQGLTGTEIEVDILHKPSMILSLLGITIAIGLFSGLYPAFVISGFRPLRALKGAFSNIKLDGQSLLLRKGLVIFQFAISIILIVSTLVIYNQWQFLRNKKLGVAADQIITVPILSQQAVDLYPTLKREWSQQAGVAEVAACSKSFTAVHNNFSNFTFREVEHTFPIIGIKEGYFESMNVPIIEGRTFEPGRKSDSTAVILNRSGWEALGEAVSMGSTLQFGGGSDQTPYQLIGVVEDFHFEPLYKKLNPVAFFLTNSNISEIAIRLDDQNPANTIAALESSWDELGLEEAFTYQFLDEGMQSLYQKEATFFRVFSLFTGLAIFIACLGLFGLTSYTAQRRTREIGIRKVIGATVMDVVYLLNKDLIYLLLIAFLVAVPLAWWGMSEWLKNFAYSTQLSWGVFFLSGAIIVLIAVLTVSYQSMKVARSNPSLALKYE